MYENPFEERYLIITEKPSVAAAIASVIGCKERKDGYFECPDGVVTWCLGHLAEYAMPDQYDPAYRNWTLETLPIIPGSWKLAVSENKAKQFRLLKNFLNNKGVENPFTYVSNAADPGREGENIFSRVYELSGSRLPVRRLWLSSMEDDAILAAFMNMKDREEYKSLAEAAVCRARADWLVGINASRAFTVTYDHRLTIGRVQSPTLSMIAERDDQIRNFQKQQYFVTHLMQEDMGNMIDAVSDHFQKREDADHLAYICSNSTATVTTIERQKKTIAPPKLYDLTMLQRDANRLFGYSASKTLDCAQALYENKLITYPRTDSNYMSDDMEKTAKDVLSACNKAFSFLTPFNVADQPDVRRIMDSKKVTDHHAIIPTVMVRNADLTQLKPDELIILSMIAARMACAVRTPHIYETSRAVITCEGNPFTATGKSILQEGWKAIEAAMRHHCGADKNDDSADKEPNDLHDGTDLSSLVQGTQLTGTRTKVTEHWTQPVKPFTEDTLLRAMQNAGTDEMDDDVERKGLGTPATRAGIIEKLVESGYISRDKKHLTVTDAGRQLAAILPDYLKSAKMTAEWENQLLMIERGQYDPKTFMDGIEQMVCRMIDECRLIDTNKGEKPRFENSHPEKSPANCPLCGSPVYEGKKSFYCADRNCCFVLWKQSRYFDSMRIKLDAKMARDLLANGRTLVKNLYSSKKKKHFSAWIVMEWKEGRADYSLDFSNQ